MLADPQTEFYLDNILDDPLVTEEKLLRTVNQDVSLKLSKIDFFAQANLIFASTVGFSLFVAMVLLEN